ncbi:hypothetical protein Tsp_02885 [Trichinella spiralis]|uniref:hypothetical protein n=1 Tax=Trichinella spiralis TaxID=6334 RepID=UPI0001EFCB86|nr:hypothetical protein Tsp_02885 [Trichinella spiralis]
MKIYSECPSFMHWNSLSRWSRQRVVNSTIINSEKIKKLASPTPLKSNGGKSLNSQRIRYPTRYLSNVKNAVRRNIEISISELVKSNRNSLGLNQEAVCNTLNSREIISDSIL